MIELVSNGLRFSFPEVHPDAALNVTFERTFRIPDDERMYRLPPSMGKFPLRHVDDFTERVPARWIEHGGVMMPMYQSEAMWMLFRAKQCHERETKYPCAVKVAAGKIDAVTGEGWRENLHTTPQDYLVVPKQPWLDGFCVQKGIIRQFVAMPLGAGYTTEEQLTGRADHGGVQIAVFPMKRSVFERKFRKRRRPPRAGVLGQDSGRLCCMEASNMGLAPGGRMKQDIYEDQYGIGDWEQDVSSRCFVHLANSMTWRMITGEPPPAVPLTAKEYEDAGLPWFDYYSETPAVDGAPRMKEIKSVATLGAEKGDRPLPENESVAINEVIRLREGLKPNQVREADF